MWASGRLTHNLRGYTFWYVYIYIHTYVDVDMGRYKFKYGFSNLGVCHVVEAQGAASSGCRGKEMERCPGRVQRAKKVQALTDTSLKQQNAPKQQVSTK